MSDDQKLWGKVRDYSGGSLQVNQPEIIGSYVFDQEFLSSCRDTVLSLSRRPEGSSLEELKCRLGISPAATREMLKYFSGLDHGVVIRGIFYSGKGFRERKLSSFQQNILKQLRESGRLGLDPFIMKIDGARTALEQLVACKTAIQLDENLFWGIEILEEVRSEILTAWPSGSRLTIEMVRNLTGLSRRYILPLFHLMEEENILIREESERIILPR